VPSTDELAELAEAFNRMSEELGRAFERERAMEQGRRDLVAAISHDLRTPLAAMRAMLEAIGDGVVQDEETVTRYHHRMRDEIAHLSHLIDDLFELSRLDAGQAALEPAAIDLRELVAETAESLEPQAQQHGVRLELASLPPTLRAWADPVQVQRVIVNLLENAIRYTGPGGSICIEARPNGETVGVTISDSGDGISSEDMPFVFDRFYRGEKSRARESGGTGLGLAISKAIVEAHGGTIRAENAPTQGARFTFTLPSAR
jgi:signal transduction histidine kinase